MDVLVTGSEGLVGAAVCRELEARGIAARRFDRSLGEDVRDTEALRARADGVDAIVHCAALLGVAGQSAQEILRVNVEGTFNVLNAARPAGAGRIVFLSSVDVLGVFKGERLPDFLPLDESHPCYPSTPYAISKHLGETLCGVHAATGGESVVCLRPPGVWDEGIYDWVRRRRAERPEFEWDPFWEYGAFIDVRDLASACVAALEPAVSGYHQLFVSAPDITTSGRTSYELVRRLHPDIEWRGGLEYQERPFMTLLRHDRAQRVLDWTPVHGWADFWGSHG